MRAAGLEPAIPVRRGGFKDRCVYRFATPAIQKNRMPSGRLVVQQDDFTSRPVFFMSALHARPFHAALAFLAMKVVRLMMGQLDVDTRPAALTRFKHPDHAGFYGPCDGILCEAAAVFADTGNNVRSSKLIAKTAY